MITRRPFGAWIVLLGVALWTLGCGERQAAPPPDTAQLEEQQRQEAEAARRREQTAAFEQRARELEGTAEALESSLGPVEGLPSTLGEKLQAVAAKAAEAQKLLAGLQQLSGEGWEEARRELETALGELETARGEAATAAAEWQGREAEALAARGAAGSPVNPDTGLIEGLDGGEYDQYLVSVVEKVQRLLRRQGLYAGPVDGFFDVGTMEAVGVYQEEQGLQVSGVPSPMTRGRLFRG